jgi:YEATS domain-containing protein 4
MPQAVVGKKFGIEQTEVSAIQRLQRAKTARLLDDHEKKNPVKRVKGVELIVPVAYGTISFWLGKKAEEYEIHPFPLIYMSL